jgi:transcriptional regulator NrdR family protein
VKEKKMPLIDDSDTTYKAVDYEKITAVLVEAVKEQQAQIDELTTILEKVTKQLNNGNNI